MSVITELQYFGSINYYKTLLQYSYIGFDIWEQYRKMSFRNRCYIAGGNGLIELSVPLINGRNQRIPFAAVQIDNRQKWQIIHWRSIVSAYNRSPWFEYYSHTLEPIFKTEYDKLVDWNKATWEWSLTSMKLKPEYGFSIPDPGIEPAADCRDLWLPRNYQEPREDISTPIYTQVFEDRYGFVPNLSILDLLFCTGPSATEFLRRH